MSHVDAATIIDLVEQRLPESAREPYQRHLAVCPHCTEEYDFWWTFLSGLGPSRLTDAPKDLIDECVAMFPKTKRPFGGFQRAHVLFDSFRQPLPAMGLRGGSVDSRRLIIRVDDLDVHIKISGKQYSRTIQGQLLFLDSKEVIDGAQISLCILGRANQFTCTNTFGEFRFDGVPAGPAHFLINLSSQGRIAQFSIKEDSHAIQC
jgi:hypothetical protein